MLLLKHVGGSIATPFYRGHRRACASLLLLRRRFSCDLLARHGVKLSPRHAIELPVLLIRPEQGGCLFLGQHWGGQALEQAEIFHAGNLHPFVLIESWQTRHF